MGRDMKVKGEKERRDRDTERHDLGSCGLVGGRERDDKDRNAVVLLQSYCDGDRIGPCQKVPVMLRKLIAPVGPFSAAYGIDHTGGGGVSRYALSYVLFDARMCVAQAHLPYLTCRRELLFLQKGTASFPGTHT